MLKPPKSLVTILGKSVRAATRLRGGGSAYPGLFVERIDPHFIQSTLAQLPEGVVVVSGTNGKTTTTKMVVELLESQGLKVFTNRTGSNFTRGVAAALLGQMTMSGKLDADIAVLELDEAHAVQFVKTVEPRYSLLLNVMRDQLDRFGEIDHTTNLLRVLAEHTSQGVVLNREDQRIAGISKSLKNQGVHYFGLDSRLLAHFPSDDALHGVAAKQLSVSADVVLKDFDDDSATFVINNHDITTPLKLRGAYNIFNAAAALTLVSVVMNGKLDQDKLIEALAHVEPAFGRGETIMVEGQPVELVLVKNPSGFRLGLQSFNPSGWATMIAINDNYADGRDMSWLWDVDFVSLTKDGVASLSGIRAYDMALRLEYDEVPIKHVEPDITSALTLFLHNYRNEPKRIYCTYTAMLHIRKDLAKITDVETIS